jgi:hypothetical protein
MRLSLKICFLIHLKGSSTDTVPGEKKYPRLTSRISDRKFLAALYHEWCPQKPSKFWSCLRCTVIYAYKFDLIDSRGSSSQRGRGQNSKEVHFYTSIFLFSWGGILRTSVSKRIAPITIPICISGTYRMYMFFRPVYILYLTWYCFTEMNDVQRLLAWLTVLTEAIINLARLDSLFCINHLPKYFSEVTQLYLSSREEVLVAVTQVSWATTWFIDEGSFYSRIALFVIKIFFYKKWGFFQADFFYRFLHFYIILSVVL